MALVILVIAAFVMAACYRFLWKSAIAGNDRWLEISEKLASQQHQRALEGLREFRALSRRRRRRLAFGRRADMDTPADQPEGEADTGEPQAESEAGEQLAEVGVQTQQGEDDDDDSSDSSARQDAERQERYRHCGLEEAPIRSRNMDGSSSSQPLRRR